MEFDLAKTSVRVDKKVMWEILHWPTTQIQWLWLEVRSSFVRQLRSLQPCMLVVTRNCNSISVTLCLYLTGSLSVWVYAYPHPTVFWSISRWHMQPTGDRWLQVQLSKHIYSTACALIHHISIDRKVPAIKQAWSMPHPMRWTNPLRGRYGRFSVYGW